MPGPISSLDRLPVALVLAVPMATTLAQEPYPSNPGAGRRQSAGGAVRRPRSAAQRASDGDRPPPRAGRGRQPAVDGRPAGIPAQNPGSPEVMRPGTPTLSGTQSARGPRECCRLRTGTTLSRHRSPFDPTPFPSADAWASAGIGHPRAHAGDQETVRAIRRARDRPREHDPGRRRPGQGDRLPREAAPHLHPRRRRGRFSGHHRPAIGGGRQEGRQDGAEPLVPRSGDPNDPSKDRI